MGKKTIIVEGGDSPEKRELIQRISKESGQELFSFASTNCYFHYFSTEYPLSEKKIWDRSHISCNAQSKYWSGSSLFSKEEKKVLDEWLAKNALVILVSPEQNKERDDWSYQVKERFDWERLRLLYWLEVQDIPHIVYHGSHTEYQKILSSITEKEKDSTENKN